MKHLYSLLHALFYTLFLVPALVLTACHRAEPTYRVGFSQCLDDAWRQTMNNEMQRELLFHPNVKLSTRIAFGSNELQCLQIDSFVQEQVDALVVSPNEAEAIRPAVSRAYRAGIPVIVADRRVAGDEWTAFIGGDNIAVGHLLGEQVCKCAAEQHRDVYLFEVMGLQGSTPAQLRHIGLLESIQNNPHIHYVGSTVAYWFEEPAMHVVDSVLRANNRINVIVAQNDLMARGAATAADSLHRDIYILGVDAMSGEHGGLQAIIDGKIDASATYRSRGDLVIQRVAQILNGQSFVRDTILPTELVDVETANLLLQANHRIDHEVEVIRVLTERLTVLAKQFKLQQLLAYSFMLIVLFLIILMVVLFYVIRYRRKVHQEREKHEAQIAHQQHQLQAMTEELAIVKASISEEDKFLQKLQHEIELRIVDPDFSVENLSEQLGMSRTSLYRKIKETTNFSPNELIRHIRLEKARRLLRETDLTIQQITYDVGFTSPSYFARCYRHKYGIQPTQEERKM